MNSYISLYVISFLLGNFGAGFLVLFGKKLNLDDIPNHRSSHRKVIPKGGGIGILIALLCASYYLSVPSCFWVPALIISICSFWGGDKHKLSPKTRLIIQFACSIFFLFSCVFSNELGNWLYLLLIFYSIFIVGTSNFYNFMDGIDGIAGITGAIGFSLLGFFAYHKGAMAPYGFLCASLSLSCIGFLMYNLPYAKIFLGDIGSVLLGFCFSCMIVILSETPKDFFIMVGFLTTFYFDELFTMIVRIRDGDSLIRAHRKHVYQILVNEFSYEHWKVSLLYGFVQLFMGLLILFVGSKGPLYLIMLYIAYILAFTIVAIFIKKKASTLCE